MPTPVIPFDNTYARDLPGFYEPCQPAAVPALLFFNRGQPRIARWNLARLAETLLPLIADDEGRPFDEDPAHARHAEPAPAAFMAAFRTFCGT